MKLYELTGTFNEIFNLLNDEDVDLQVLENTLQSIEEAFEVKVGGVAKIIKSLEVSGEGFEREAKRLADKKKATENRIKWLKDYLLRALETTAKDKVQTDIGTVRRQKNPASVNVLDASLLPFKYLVISPPPPPAVDKKAILDDIKRGAEVPGAEIHQGYHIRIQ
ncbi:siphovirus Gp157 family protein [Desulforamulus reducens MI-1]|uniref:Siphovirus Gp157 family protein n=1 Tax=Desulforamulus reducens (strain ATCC BAA-1160 / DSM 100696 / MI-1) TaxID=349161 RepID=A4J7S6_DESRM|nr:siphovirus Gp157 family protein [Desulforamulus reducens]ABO51129.1 siphovirus Gp157 family protein [Desulforamulus reducens MI-1]